MEPFDSSRLVWTREPSASLVSPARIEIVTKPHTDLWQRTLLPFPQRHRPGFADDHRGAVFFFYRQDRV